MSLDDFVNIRGKKAPRPVKSELLRMAMKQLNEASLRGLKVYYIYANKSISSCARSCHSCYVTLLNLGVH